MLGVDNEEFKELFGITLNQNLEQKDWDILVEKFVTAIIGGVIDENTGGKLNRKEKARATARNALVTGLRKKISQIRNVNDFSSILKEEVIKIDLNSNSDSKSTSFLVESKKYIPENNPTMRQLLKDLWNYLRNTQNFEDPVENAAEANAKQVKRLSEAGTIWHAVSSFGKPEGDASWRLVKIVNKILLQGEEKSPDSRKKALAAPWMKGDDRGNFGETPLHIAILFNNPGDDFTKFFQELWVMCPHLHKAEYTEVLYHGENVLHIAIIKKAGLDIIQQIVESAAGESLLKGRSDGDFFKQAAHSNGACHNLGEYPLCFAACTNQPDVFNFLISRGADLTVTTSEGHNLLHLMVLNAFNRAEGDLEIGDGCTVEEAYMHMYDTIVSCLKEKTAPSGRGTLFEKLRTDRNKDGYTPLTLAAAMGSLSFFTHLFSQEVVVAWIYGPVTCRKLDLEGIDISLDTEPAAAELKGAASALAGCGSGGLGQDTRDLSVLEILVLHERKDILSKSQVDKLVENKWAKYGRRVFHHKLAAAVLFTAIVYVITIGGGPRHPAMSRLTRTGVCVADRGGLMCGALRRDGPEKSRTAFPSTRPPAHSMHRTQPTAGDTAAISDRARRHWRSLSSALPLAAKPGPHACWRAPACARLCARAGRCGFGRLARV